MKENNSLWEKIGNKCLERAEELLEDKDTTPEQAEVASKLIYAAIEIDRLNLRWAEQSRSCAAVYSRRASEQTAKAD